MKSPSAASSDGQTPSAFSQSTEVEGETAEDLQWRLEMDTLKEYEKMSDVPFTAMPPAVGLYNPTEERDACGVGCIAQIHGKDSRLVVSDAGKLLVRMSHRGAKEGQDGDGAGILLGIPHDFFRKVTHWSFTLPERGKYGVGMCYLPQEEAQRNEVMDVIEDAVIAHGLAVLGWRAPLPVKSTILGPKAKATEPFIAQIFVSMPKDQTPEEAQESPSTTKRHVAMVDPSSLPDDLETRLFVIRKKLAKKTKNLYVCSFSSRTVVYKGQLQAEQLFAYFDDLMDEDLTSYIALVHSRFSTNTFPSWPRAQPFRMLCHNGEINTVSGNRHWVKARESTMGSISKHRVPFFKEGAEAEAEHQADDSSPLDAFFPVDESIGSDSATLDNVVEFLHKGGRELEKVMLMVIPEAWQNDDQMAEEKKAFYRYHSCLFEPWDGPALVAFTDGKKVGAVLDRNGLRPGRFWITEDDRLILASEVGVVDILPERVKAKGRLMPGRMLLIDFEKKQIAQDDEVKMAIALERPYGRWIEEKAFFLEKIARPLSEEEIKVELQLDDKKMMQRMKMFGFTWEKVEMLLAPMAKRAAEALGSMGNDIPLACLSHLPRNPADYFAQLFAQVGGGGG
eukprot:Cvel_30583.t1-p1 / transcript=Cvel_30583.t1 / gene=Cvel_30583 / organism=Chromera_velia_CCMP2878 / gene_product=Glutamate synthase [NADH], amyloplastic, putative / transcript_product=Glutamate synthase [NADH], amyloplastic, putative / location=Cvel_scaffold4381:1-4733(-) / protein_length=619 / sequence_SO=supercontig / SO=protein_coding / is_pseudo=false